MKMKMVLCALALAMVFTACGGYNKEADFEVSPSDDEKSVVITGYNGEKLNVKIPPLIQKMPVTGIGRGAFEDAKITGVTIPKSVTVIDEDAFSDCADLTSITVDGKNPAYASEGGILYNKEKTTVILVPGISGTVTLPASVTSIGDYAFSGCESITGVTIPASVTEIGVGAFYYCTGLTNITLPANITEIGGNVFRECASLTAITIPANVTEIGNNAFADCTGLTAITIPEGVTSIGESAFYGCTGIAEITIPASVTRIRGNAFYGWNASQTINVAGHASQAAADKAWGYRSYNSWIGDLVYEGWRVGCRATINYAGN